MCMCKKVKIFLVVCVCVFESFVDIDGTCVIEIQHQGSRFI